MKIEWKITGGNILNFVTLIAGAVAFLLGNNARMVKLETVMEQQVAITNRLSENQRTSDVLLTEARAKLNLPVK